MTLMEEYARRRIALAIQDETLRSVTRREHAQLHGVTPSAETLQTAAGGRAGGAGEGPQGQKSRTSPRAPAPLKPRRGGGEIRIRKSRSTGRRSRTGGKMSSC